MRLSTLWSLVYWLFPHSQLRFLGPERPSVFAWNSPCSGATWTLSPSRRWVVMALSSFDFPSLRDHCSWNHYFKYVVQLFSCFRKEGCSVSVTPFWLEVGVSKGLRWKWQGILRAWLGTPRRHLWILLVKTRPKPAQTQGVEKQPAPLDGSSGSHTAQGVPGEGWEGPLKPCLQMFCPTVCGQAGWS